MSGVKDEIGEKAREALRLFEWCRGYNEVKEALKDRDRLRERVAELEECFAPIVDWYGDEGLTPRALADAVHDLASDRKAVRELREQVADLEAQGSAEDEYQAEVARSGRYTTTSSG